MGGVSSNAVDMVKWLRFNLNEGRTPDGTPLIDSERLRVGKTRIATVLVYN